MNTEPQKVLSKRRNYYIMRDVLQREEHGVGSTSGAVENVWAPRATGRWAQA